MKFYGEAESAAARIVELFRSGNLPKALAPVFIHRGDDSPCRRWSWSNQVLVMLAGYDDARGIRQWGQVGRNVRKGERAFFILAPVLRTITETNENGETRQYNVLCGFKSVPVFGLEQTEGEPLPGRDDRFIDSLPVVEVARVWGLNVDTFDGRNRPYAGVYQPGQSIRLGVENVSVWAHELIHAADDRAGTLTRGGGQRLDNEVVAELGGAVLLTALGMGDQADYGGCWNYVQGYAEGHGKHTLTICEALLKRTCDAVVLILKTADEVAAQATPVAA